MTMLANPLKIMDPLSYSELSLGFDAAPHLWFVRERDLGDRPGGATLNLPALTLAAVND